MRYELSYLIFNFMAKAQIKLAFRIVITKDSQSRWEKFVWDSTYQEFLMQSQLYNDAENSVLTFKQLLSKNEKAEKLHFLVSMAAHPYLLQWKGLVYPMPDTLGNNYLPFNNYRLDIIDSNIKDKNAHEIGITFYSPLLTLIDIWDGHYLVSTNENITEGVETMMFKMQPRLSVVYYKSI
jgi:hypothetical protein